MRPMAGYSLIELVVVIVIAGILAALAIPRLTDTESKAGWYKDQVLATVRFAQRQAVAQRRNVFVCVQATSVSVSYASGCADAALPAGSASQGYAAAILQIPQQLGAPSGVTVGATTTPFSFNALGQPSAGAVTITITGSGTRAVNVAAETGYVS